jgi:hypothetical protein
MTSGFMKELFLARKSYGIKILTRETKLPKYLIKKIKLEKLKNKK